jgi:hypothetical protein
VVDGRGGRRATKVGGGRCVVRVVFSGDVGGLQ